MQRKATKTTRAANAEEKKFQTFTKESDCIVCDNSGPSIVHHCMGATYKHNKVLIGHWFVLPLCQACDDVITHGSRRTFKDKFGLQSDYWHRHYAYSAVDAPIDVYKAIMDCNE